MSKEATIQSMLQIRKGSMLYQSQPNNFTADVSVANGPSPGAVTVTTSGTQINFGQLLRPALCRIMNLDPTNWVTYGIKQGVDFFPLGELLPGESYVLRLSRHLGEEYVGTGTGVVNSSLTFKANAAACVVLVEAFDA